MSTLSDGASDSGTNAPRRGRRLQTDVRTLLVLVACCGLILWAWRYLAENVDPVLREARAIQRRAISALGSSKRPAERVSAIHELERLHSGDVSITIPPLVAALDDADNEVRLAAAGALGSIGYGEVKSRSASASLGSAAIALARCVQDPDTTFRVAAAQNLGTIGASLVKSGSGGPPVTAAVNALVTCLNNLEPGVRSAAVRSLNRCASLASSGTVAKVLGPTARVLVECVRDADPGVRTAAARSLAWVDSPRLAQATSPPIDRKTVMSALGALLHDPDADVRCSAMSALASRRMDRDEPPAMLAEGLKDESAKNRARTIQLVSCERKGLDYWVPLLLDLAVPDPDPEVQDGCLGIWGSVCRPPAITAALVPDLIFRLRSRDARIRGWAAWLLGVLGAEARAAIPALLRVINEPLDPLGLATIRPHNVIGPDPASTAAWALGQIAPGSAEEKESIATLREVVRSGPVSRRGRAALALGEFKEAAKEAAPLFIKLLSEAANDDQFEGASRTARVLGKIAPETPLADQVIVALLPALDSKVSSVQQAVIVALARFGPRAAAALPRIRALKDDRNRDVREAAARALFLIEGTDVD